MSSRNIGPFVFISAQSPQIGFIGSILKARIPKSAHVYNMSVMYPRFADKMKFYVYQESEIVNADPVEKSAWIFATYFRLDYGVQVCISAPEAATSISAGILQALEEPTTSFIDWSKPYEFNSIDSKISGSLIELVHRLTKTDANTRGLEQVTVFECHHYVPADNAKLESQPPPPSPRSELPEGAFIAPLNTQTGAKLLYDSWPHAKKGLSEVELWDLVTRLHSAAVYVDVPGAAAGATEPVPVSWSFLHELGHLAIQTKEEYRGRGFASLCFQKMVTELQNYGYYPCAMVHFENVASNKVLRRGGMKPSPHSVHLIYFGRVFS